MARNKLKKLAKKIISDYLGYYTCPKKYLPLGTSLPVDLENIRPLSSFRCVFDVGANLGQTVLKFSELFPCAEIHAFEPVADNFDKLAATIGTRRGVRLNKMALSDFVGVSEININPSPGTHSLNYQHGSGLKETIKLTTLDAYCAENGIGKIDLCKIDVEGHERNVLSGAANTLSRGLIDFLYVESELLATEKHFIPIDVLSAILAPHGYKLVSLYEQQRHWKGSRALNFANVLFASPSVCSLE